ncbi:MAG TPA: hypothetical protein VF092_17135 [Longimicrobium sp.]
MSLFVLVLIVLAAVPGVFALALVIRRRPIPPPPPVDREPARNQRTVVDPDEAQARTLVPALERRLLAVEKEAAELRQLLGAMQEDVRDLAENARAAAPPRNEREWDRGSPPRPVERPLRGAGAMEDYDYGTHMVDLGGTEPGGRGVDLEGGQLVLSRSLEAVATLAGGGDGRPARLSLNESIEIDHMALDRWKEFFDFEGGAAYRRYRTTKAALVDWNESAGRGRLIEKGVAKQL